MGEHVEITPTARLLIEQDQDASCPRGDWHMITGFVKIRGRGDSRRMDVPAVHEPEIPIAEAHDRLDEEDTVRWARIFHGLFIEYDSAHGGYWFVAGADAATAATAVDRANRALFYDNFPDLVPGSPEHLAQQEVVITQEQETYRQWAEGEVYTVALERASTYAPVHFNERGEVWDLPNPLTTADMFQVWAEEQSIGDTYLDDKYTAQVVALEFFELTADERTAIETEINA